MRQFTRAVIEKEKIEAIIAAAQVCRLAFFDEEFPYIVPLNFGYDEGSLYFHCALEGRKLDLLRRNPQVGFELEGIAEIDAHPDQACQWGSRYQSVIGSGIASMLLSAGNKRRALDIIMRHYAPKKTWNYPDVHLSQIAAIQVQIREMTGKQSRHFVATQPPA